MKMQLPDRNIIKAAKSFYHKTIEKYEIQKTYAEDRPPTPEIGWDPMEIVGTVPGGGGRPEWVLEETFGALEIVVRKGISLRKTEMAQDPYVKLLPRGT